MSFLFKSKPKGGNELPRTTRDIRSSDGTPSPGSQIPTLNGVVNGQKPGSPTPGQSVNNSLNSLSSAETARPPTRPTEERVAYMPDSARSSGPPSPELRNGRDRSQEAVCPV